MKNEKKKGKHAVRYSLLLQRQKFKLSLFVHPCVISNLFNFFSFCEMQKEFNGGFNVHATIFPTMKGNGTGAAKSKKMSKV